jgi:hypothetical protein
MFQVIFIDCKQQGDDGKILFSFQFDNDDWKTWIWNSVLRQSANESENSEENFVYASIINFNSCDKFNVDWICS